MYVHHHHHPHRQSPAEQRTVTIETKAINFNSCLTFALIVYHKPRRRRWMGLGGSGSSGVCDFIESCPLVTVYKVCTGIIYCSAIRGSAREKKRHWLIHALRVVSCSAAGVTIYALARTCTASESDTLVPWEGFRDVANKFANARTHGNADIYYYYYYYYYRLN